MNRRTKKPLRTRVLPKVEALDERALLSVALPSMAPAAVQTQAQSSLFGPGLANVNPAVLNQVTTNLNALTNNTIGQLRALNNFGVNRLNALNGFLSNSFGAVNPGANGSNLGGSVSSANPQLAARARQLGFVGSQFSNQLRTGLFRNFATISNNFNARINSLTNAANRFDTTGTLGGIINNFNTTVGTPGLNTFGFNMFNGLNDFNTNLNGLSTGFNNVLNGSDTPFNVINRFNVGGRTALSNFNNNFNTGIGTFQTGASNFLAGIGSNFAGIGGNNGLAGIGSNFAGIDGVGGGFGF